MLGAVALEGTWHDRFDDGATEAQRGLLDRELAAASVSAADRLRDEALAAGAGGALADDGALYFSSSSRKIDLITATADEVAADLRADAAASRRTASRERVLLVLLGVAALTLIAALFLLLHRMVLRPIGRLTEAAHAAARDVLPRAVAAAHSHGPDAAAGVARPLEVASDDELGRLTEAFNDVQRTAVGLAAEQATLRRNVSDVFVNLGRRTQNLITRQLEHIDHLEDRTDEPDTLAELFTLDHLSTRLRRNAENMLVLAGAESPRPWARPVSIASVVRAALAESTDYARVDLAHLEPVAVLGAAVSDVSHLLAELVDNALAFSPPTARVVVAGRHLPGGSYGLAVEDAGMGMPPERLAWANTRVSDPPTDDFAVSRFLGLYVVGRLAERHGVQVSLSDSRFGGVTAHVLLPATLIIDPSQPREWTLPEAAPPQGPPPPGPPAGPLPGPPAQGQQGRQATLRPPPAPSPAYNPAPTLTGRRDG